MEGFNDTEVSDSRIYPSIMNRIQALFFDVWIIIAIVILLSGTIFPDFENRYAGIKILTFFIILLIYEPVSNMTGGTIGYRTMGMKIRRFSDNNKKINITQAYSRSLVKLVLGWMSFLTVSVDPQNRAMHDKASDTVVLHTRE